jgi:hypothetical protein
VGGCLLLLAECGGGGGRGDGATTPDAGAPLIGDAPAATVVCGKVIGVGAGTFVQDVSRGGRITFTAAGMIYLKLTSDCARGDKVALSRAAKARIVETVPAGDGLAAAVVIQPERGAHFRVRTTGATTLDIPVVLGPEPLPI